MGDHAALLLDELRVRSTDKRLRFDEFMDVVLYHPTLGYYSRSAERAGRQGDFLTSPEVAPLFGECIAQWMEGVWVDVGRPPRFDVVEVGAGRGTLAASVLAAVPPPFAAAIRLHLVERGTSPRGALEARWSGDARVRVYEDVSQLPERFDAGVLVANELFDNLPVRRLMKADGWQEILVRVRGQGLREDLAPAPADLVGLAQRHGLDLDEGQSAEVCPQAERLLTDVLGRLASGGVLIFDYGGEADEVSGDAAPNGTLAAHRGHARHTDLYSHLGDQDVTAHVNFTPLRRAAESLGFRPVRLVSQTQFLVEHGLPQRFVQRLESEPDPFQRLRLTQFSKQLYHPETLGGAFRALYATKRQ